MNEVIDRRSTDQIVEEVCAALSVERVEIRPAPTTTQQVVYTSDAHYYGNDRLDVSPGSADPVGGWFAPSAEIAELLRCAVNSGHEDLARNVWSGFEEDYTAEMRVRFGMVPGSENWPALASDAQESILNTMARGVEPTPTAWDALLAMREVTLVCTCTDSTRCHRVLLARILEKLGARYAGEV